MTASCLSTSWSAGLPRTLPAPGVAPLRVPPVAAPRRRRSLLPVRPLLRRRDHHRVGCLALVGSLLLAAAWLAPEQPQAQADICLRHNGVAACRVW